MKRIIFSLVLICCRFFCIGQTLYQCATPTPSHPQIFSIQDLQQAERTIDYQYVLNIYVHILRNNDGSNAATNETQLNIDLQRMANFFKPHNICFMLKGVNYINNTTLNNSMNPGIGAHVTALFSNNVVNCINMYVHTGLGDGSGGNSYAIPSNNISILQSTNFNFEHEMGHALGLIHTFETVVGVSCPDGSNCSTTGDLVCDTQADFSGSENMRTGCTYTGTLVINCNGSNQTYNPPRFNIMSYWAACYSQFTAQQGIRMRATIPGTSFLNNSLAQLNYSLITNLTPVSITGPVNLTAKNEITFGSTGPATIFMGGSGEKILNAGERVRLQPGTIISPSSEKIRFSINPFCD
jgi:Pregnancy-associated plasma protein-A